MKLEEHTNTNGRVDSISENDGVIYIWIDGSCLHLTAAEAMQIKRLLNAFIIE